jgi:hypothetical protein
MQGEAMKLDPGTTATPAASSRYMAKPVSAAIIWPLGVRLPITPAQLGWTWNAPSGVRPRKPGAWFSRETTRSRRRWNSAMKQAAGRVVLYASNNTGVVQTPMFLHRVFEMAQEG